MMMAGKKKAKVKPDANAPLGQGGRFAALAAKIGPGAAAAAGRAKYGKAGMQALAEHGTAGAPVALSGAKKIAKKKAKKTGG